MQKLIVLLFFFALNLQAKEYIVEIKPGAEVSKDLKDLSKREFRVLGKTYLIVEEGNQLAPFSEVSRIEENFEVHTMDQTQQDHQGVPLLSDFSKQWALQNIGKNEPVTTTRMSPLQGVVGADVNALKAWEITKGSKDVVVAIIDTGVDADHIELRDNMWINEAELNGRKGVDDDGNGFVDDIHGYDFVGNDGNPDDGYGHGTHCAGIVGASHTKGKIMGVMKNVSIMSVRMMDNKGRGKLEQSIKAVGYAIENGAHVLSNSWGSRGYSEILENLFKEANKRGIIAVAAAGNSRFNNNDESPTYPATYNSPNIISVSAINAQNRHAAYSTYGPKTVHVGAPGTNVLSTFIKKRRYREIYRVTSGTSMATPYAAGLVGLYLSHHGFSKAPAEIKDLLIKTSVAVPDLADKNVAKGRVDGFNFLSH
jgi:thermitase